MVRTVFPFLMLAFTALSLAATGCASASVRSAREPGELPRLSRLFVVGNPLAGSPENSARLGELSNAVMNKLAERGIAASAQVLDPREPGSPDTLRQRIEEWKAEGVLLLTLAMTEAWVASGGMGGVAAERMTTTRIEALLTPVGSDRRSWSATCQYGRTSKASQAILDSCAQRLVEQLFKDGMLASSRGSALAGGELREGR
ncbi:hypothetical protein [Hyalangium sp.]|uniref:hypothetical protein n=1 Tax=Hyalangium sp. TaxID=2028555 RepID=UPI002D3F1166|nr:hypothetical protein [Hyalangium sp.]HYH97230.1 hypothetical protein [Hyalangium sp.]